MDVIRLIHKALSDEDIGTILGTDAKVIRYSELRHIDDLDERPTHDLDYCFSCAKTDPTEAIGPPCQDTTVYMSTSIILVIS
ncbi:MAG: hypothetical protein ACKPKO_32515, partial [Candidatus Fonsibacter sp.]